MSFKDTAPPKDIEPDHTFVGRAYFFVTNEALLALLTAGYDEILVEKRKSFTDTFAQLGDRIPLRADQNNYSVVDLKAKPGMQYRPTVVKSDNSLTPVVYNNFVTDAVNVNYETIYTVQELKDFFAWGLLGLFQDSNGNPFPDRLYVHYLLYAITKFEQKTRLRVLPTQFTEDHDYYPRDVSEFYTFQLDEFPTISVEDLKLRIPGAQDFTFNPDTIQLDGLLGTVNIVPGPIGSVGAPLLRGKWFPRAFRFKYTAGFALGQLPENIRSMIGKEAISGPLNIGGDLVGGAAIASQSMTLDGLSQSVNTTSSPTMAGFGARLIQYNNELKREYPVIVDYWKGRRAYIG